GGSTAIAPKARPDSRARPAMLTPDRPGGAARLPTPFCQPVACSGEFKRASAGFVQSWLQGGEVARSRARVELRADDLFPRRAAGRRGAWQREQEGAIGQARERARLQRRCADFLERDRTEQFAETRHLLVEQGQQCFRS